jgi:hypothetical protein
MECARARAAVWPPQRPRIADAELIAARAHIASCAACRAHFEIDGWLAEARQRLLGAAPEKAIRERVFEAVAEARSVRSREGRSRRSRVIGIGLLAAVAAAALLTATIRLATAPGDRPLDAAFVDDYMRLAVREDHIMTTDSAEVRRFLLRELGTAIAPLTSPGFRIVGAEVCLLEGRRGAMIRYETAAGTVSYYLLPRPGATDRPPTVGAAPAGGAALVKWVSGSVERALVGPLPVGDLLGVARAQGL